MIDRWELGVSKLGWLAREDFRDVPIMISRSAFVQPNRKRETGHPASRPLRERREVKPALAGLHGLDSSAFAMVDTFGDWPIDDPTWAHDASLIVDQFGPFGHISPRDRMCEPWMLAKTGKTVLENQTFTTRSVLELRGLRPDLPWIPVLQGWAPEDYERHADDYERHGIDLAREPLVGIGSVCKRAGKSLAVAPDIFGRLARRGIRCHAFGLAVRGLEDLARAGLFSAGDQPGIVSADSQAGPSGARKKALAARADPTIDSALYLMPGHDLPNAAEGRRRGHKNCGCGCAPFSLAWGEKVRERIWLAMSRARPPRRQLDLFSVRSAA